MKRKVIVVICIVIIIAALIIGTLIYLDNHKLEKEAKENIEQFTELVINGGTADELSETLGYKEIQPMYILSGKDAYLRDFPEENVISQNGLEKYVEANKTYTSNVEEKLKKNLEYNLKAKKSTKDEATIEVEYRRYCFVVYIMDLDVLQSTILEKTKATDDISRYKAKVVAMKILDNNLDVYKSQEKLTTTVLYKEKKDDEVKKSFNSYFLKLGGFSGIDSNIDKLQNNREKRINSYLDDAIKKGVIDSNNLLNI